MQSVLGVIESQSGVVCGPAHGDRREELCRFCPRSERRGLGSPVWRGVTKLIRGGVTRPGSGVTGSGVAEPRSVVTEPGSGVEYGDSLLWFRCGECPGGDKWRSPLLLHLYASGPQRENLKPHLPHLLATTLAPLQLVRARLAVGVRSTRGVIGATGTRALADHGDARHVLAVFATHGDFLLQFVVRCFTGNRKSNQFRRMKIACVNELLTIGVEVRTCGRITKEFERESIEDPPCGSTLEKLRIHLHSLSAPVPRYLTAAPPQSGLPCLLATAWQRRLRWLSDL